MIQKAIALYLLLINFMAFVIYAFDKYRAIKKGYRISEKTLHLYALLGGFLGASLSMALFRHKVSKPSFLIKHIVIILVWIIAILYYFIEINPLNFVGVS